VEVELHVIVTSAIACPGKETFVHIAQEAGWSLKPAQMAWQRNIRAHGVENRSRFHALSTRTVFLLSVTVSLRDHDKEKIQGPAE
jgi:hypothetical protein